MPHSFFRARRAAFSALLLTVLLAGCAATRLETNTAPFRVMSFNIRFDNPGDGEDAWPHRQEKAASMIRFHHADIAGLQEALKHQIEDLAERLPEYAWIGVGRDDGKDAGEFTPIFYRKARFDLLEHDTFWLSETPQVPGSKSWDAAITRIATWAVFGDRASGRRFLLLNTHFDHIGVEARGESARLIAERLEALAGNLPSIVMGDFNSTEDTNAYDIMTSRLKDAFYLSEHPNHGSSSSWNGFQAIEPGRRIDYIFMDDRVRVLQHGILSETFDGRFPSDHLPVLAEVALR
jgi:endonuclease/exonuclease/phosphatase family metal-dependent hydrolase